MLRNLLAIISLSIFISIAIFGVGTMSYCIFNSNAAFCHMNVLEHIASWQVTFIALSVLLLIVFFFVATVVFSLVKDSFTQFRFKKHLNISFFDPIKQALSQGIINPKIH